MSDMDEGDRDGDKAYSGAVVRTEPAPKPAADGEVECGKALLGVHGTRFCRRPAGHTGGHTATRPARTDTPVKPGATLGFLESLDEIERLTRMVETANAQRDEAFNVAKAERVAADKSIRALVDLLWRCHPIVADDTEGGPGNPALAEEIVDTLDGYGNGDRHPTTSTAEKIAGLENELAQHRGHEVVLEAELARMRGLLAEAEHTKALAEENFERDLAVVRAVSDAETGLLAQAQQEIARLEDVLDGIEGRLANAFDCRNAERGYLDSAMRCAREKRRD